MKWIYTIKYSTLLCHTLHTLDAIMNDISKTNENKSVFTFYIYRKKEWEKLTLILVNVGSGFPWVRFFKNDYVVKTAIHTHTSPKTEATANNNKWRRKKTIKMDGKQNGKHLWTKWIEDLNWDGIRKNVCQVYDDDDDGGGWWWRLVDLWWCSMEIITRHLHTSTKSGYEWIEKIRWELVSVGLIG